jgi:hypothetical protein
VSSFAYPYGRREHYTERTVRLVKQAGFACACANMPGQASAASGDFELPRLQIQEWSGEELRARLLLPGTAISG